MDRDGARLGQCLLVCACASFEVTAARRAALASIRSGNATASPPAPIARAFHRETVRALGKRRIVIDRHRKTKTCQAFPAAGRTITTRTATAHLAVCMPAAA